MTDEPDTWDELLEGFKATMKWSESATDDEKTLVAGNLNGFVGFLRRSEYGLYRKRHHPDNCICPDCD